MATLEELDSHLNRWQKAVDVVVANVYELYEHPVHRALAGPSPGGHVTATGESRGEVERACEAISQLLLCGNELRAVVARARTLREGLPRVFREGKIEEIERLLSGPAIQLPGADVPLTQRGLLSETVASGRALSLQEMLDTMVPAFEAAKRTIFAVDRAWATLLPRLDEADLEWGRLRAEVESGGLGGGPGLLDLRQQIEGARARVKLDPLGASRAWEQRLSPALIKARTEVETILADQRQTRMDLTRARALQRELEQTHARAMIVSGDCRAKVAVAASEQPAPLSTACQIEDAGRWLAQLDALMAQTGTRPSVGVGVRRWLETTRLLLDHEQAVLRANQVLLDERQELRGRLDALHAKATGSGLAEDTHLAEEAQAARALLYQRPTPLARARESVALYQSRLNARIAKARA